MKGLEGFDLIAHHIVAVKNLGGADRLFGGTMLAWLDEAGASYAILQARSSGMVTRHIEAMDFLAPGRLGDVLGIYGRVSKTGRTSISVEMRVLAEDPVGGTRVGLEDLQEFDGGGQSRPRGHARVLPPAAGAVTAGCGSSVIRG